MNLFYFALTFDECKAAAGKTFFGLPTWYKYLQPSVDGIGNCTYKLAGINNGYWLIGAAILEMLLRIAAFVSVGYIIYGGVKFVVSQGNPDQVQTARRTVINAVAGLVIAIIATGLVTFIAGSFKAVP